VRPAAGDRPRLSVIVVVEHTHSLGLMVDALSRQVGIARDEFEVIVVDAIRQRDWRDLVTGQRPAVDERLDLRLVEMPPSCRAKAVNRALDLATADIVLFLADDFIPRPGVLAAHLRFHQHHPAVEVAAVGPGLFPDRLRRSSFRRWLEDSGALLGVSFTGPHPNIPPGFFYIANTSLKRAMVDRAGRFDERFPFDAWDDMEFGQRLVHAGYRSHYLAEAVCEHEHAVTLAERLEHMGKAGISAAIFERIHPTAHHPWRYKGPGLATADVRLPALSRWRRMNRAARIGHIRRMLDAAFARAYLEQWVRQGAGEAGLTSEQIGDFLDRSEDRAAREGRDAPVVDPEDRGRMEQALAAQQRGELDVAEQLYWAVLAKEPGLPDALHMLGVVRYQKGRPDDGARLIQRAIACYPSDVPAARMNLGLCLASKARLREAAAVDDGGAIDSRAAAVRPARARRPHPGAETLVSVIVPSYNHGRYIGEALRSIWRQTYRDLELIVIDDGSTDGSPGLVERMLAESPIPTRFVARENRGAAATINEGMRMARGRYVTVLNSDDLYADDRVERLLALLDATGARWAFSGVRFIPGATGEFSADDTAKITHLGWLSENLEDLPAVSHAFLHANVAISTGNLFMERQFAIECGPFEDLRYNHDWEFCLRAIWMGEPAYLPEPAYLYRLHGSNTINESRGAALAEANAILAAALARSRSAEPPANPLAPTRLRWGDAVLVQCLEAGLGSLVPAGVLQELAAKLDRVEDRAARSL
jgi:glycosyltransferase involved in cell wall biosynthesis